MIIATALSAIAVFTMALTWCRIDLIVAEVMHTSHAGASAMRDSLLDDRARELAVQRAAVQLLAASGSLLLRLALAAVAAVVPIVLADLSGLTSFEGVTNFLSTWPAMIVATVLGGAVYARRGSR